jgi:hypothetical protein
LSADGDKWNCEGLVALPPSLSFPWTIRQKKMKKGRKLNYAKSLGKQEIKERRHNS